MLRACLFAAVVSVGGVAAHAEPLALVAADGVTVDAEVWRAAAPRAASGATPRAAPPIVLAFHQAEASRGEYAPIAPRLAAAGFTVVAIDQRSGGPFLGGRNRTVERLGRSTEFVDALPDLEAALAWAKANGRGAPVIAMGSSYSAALVFLLAARHSGDLAAVVAYSPGEYLGGPHLVRDAARTVRVPVFVGQAGDPAEIAASKAIVAALPGRRVAPFTSAASSVHGASTLRADQNPTGADAQWQALLAFLTRFAPR